MRTSIVRLSDFTRRSRRPLTLISGLPSSSRASKSELTVRQKTGWFPKLASWGAVQASLLRGHCERPMRATDVVDVLRSGGTAQALGVGRRALLQVDDETSSGNKVLGIGVGAFAIFVLWCACFAFGSATLEPTLTFHDRTVTSYAHPFSVISCLTCWVGTNTKQSG